MPYLKDPVNLISDTVIKAFDSSQVPIKIFGGDTTGQGLSIGAGGATIVGSGEAKEQVETNVNPTVEDLYLTSDNIIKLITNLQNGWNNRKEILIDNGIFNALGYKWNGQSLDDRYINKSFHKDIAPSSSAAPSLWLDGIYVKEVYNQDYPCTYGHLLSMRGGTGGANKSTTQILMSWKDSAIWYRCSDDLTNGWKTNWIKLLLENVVNGSYNTAFGTSTLKNNTTSANANAAFGYNCMAQNTTGINNAAFGCGAFEHNATGNSNTSIGHNSLFNSVSGSSNVALGDNALTFKQDGSAMTNFSWSVGLGSDTRVSGNNQVQLGKSGQTVYGSSTYNVRSDARDKSDIQDLTYNAYEFIKKIKPRNFRWNRREDYESEEIISIDEYKSADDEIKKFCIPVVLTEQEYNELKSDKEYYTKFIESTPPPFPKNAKNSDEINVEETIKHDQISYKAYKFHYQYMSDESKKGKRLHNGFIAQEVKAVADEMGFDFAGFQDHKVNGGCDVYTLGYEQFIAPMVSAMQIMMKQIDDLKKK